MRRLVFLFLIISALALFFAIPEIAFSQAAPSNTDELFQTPKDTDASMKLLHVVFGPMIDWIWKGTDTFGATDSKRIIATGIGIFNAVVLILAVIFVLHTILRLVAETAAEGIAFGGATDTKYTMLRIALGVVLLLPVKAGYLVIQLVAFYIVMSGVGLANVSWSYFSDQYFTHGGTVAASSTTSTPAAVSPNTRDRIVDATFTLVNGHLCRKHVNAAADVASSVSSWPFSKNPILGELAEIKKLKSAVSIKSGGTGGVYSGTFGGAAVGAAVGSLVPVIGTAVGGLVGGVMGWGVAVWNATASEKYDYRIYYFPNERGPAGNDTELCGTINVLVSKSGGPTTSNFGTKLYEALDSVVQRHLPTMIKGLSVDAEKLAREIYSGTGGDGKRDTHGTDGFLVQFKKTVDDAAITYTKKVDDVLKAELTSQKLQNAQTEVVQQVTKSGWLTAPLYQRTVVGAGEKITRLRNYLELTANNRYDDGIGELYTKDAYTDKRKAARALFQKTRDDFEYMRTLAPLVRNIKANSTSPGAKGAGAKRKDVAERLNILASTFKALLIAPATGDPFIAYTQLGNAIMAWAVPALGVGLVADFFGVEMISGALNFMLLLGVLFVVVIPFIPILYFLSGIISWLILVIEAVIALPLVAVRWLVPARSGQGMLGDAMMRALVMLFALLVRPFFMVLGLVLCVVIVAIGKSLIDMFTVAMLDVAAPSGTGIASSLALMIGVVAIYAFTSISLVTQASGLIVGLGDAVVGWFGTAVQSRLGDSEMQASTQRMGQVAPIPGGTGVGVRSSMGSMKGPGAGPLGAAARRVGSKFGGLLGRGKK